ncbi:substrate-binding domain-containing protein [Carboxylicivirga mesophila]|uniref:Substrate-binding domain-containing protein n=1 Tax=Carboxylicivirga mesophila TaxID=1166478 RepID=A0ABS5KFQ7_9BACT|nr:substrate-binding domain-containing protein [Carboxylicivirga mesophila]MBS2213361.1 substrate-binding domain-containing protein [Carboxylicivirga mesophila]
MRNIKWLIGLLVVTMLSACQSDNGIKLGFIYSSPITDRYVREADYFKEYAEKNNVKVYVEHGNGDAAIQYQKAIELFDKGIDGLAIIAVNANTAAAIVREGNERGVKVMAYNRLIKNSDLDFFVSGDNDVLGKITVDEIIKVKPSGDAVILGGDKYDRNAVELMASIKKYLQPHIESGNIELKYVTYIEDWSGENAAYELEQYLSYTGEVPDMIFAGFDGIANSCIEVLERYGNDKTVYISGQDATIDGAKNVLAGKQQMTAFHPLKDAANKAAEVMIELVKNERKARQMANAEVNNGQVNVPTVKIPSVSITKENIEKVLIDETQFYTREQIY